MADTMTLIEKTVFLKSVDVLSSVPTEALAQLAGRAKEVRCERGMPAYREGEEDTGTSIVVEGLLELRRNGKAIRHLRPGEAHGELFLAEGGAHEYEAVALEDSHLLNLRRSDVIDALLEYPEFGLAMVQDLARRHHLLTQRLLELTAELESSRPAAPSTSTLEHPPAPTEPKRRGWWRSRRAAPAPKSAGS
jgi:CRP-like cAMP-binding protein